MFLIQLAVLQLAVELESLKLQEQAFLVRLEQAFLEQSVPAFLVRLEQVIQRELILVQRFKQMAC